MEKKYSAIYLSGTGNTKFCVEKFVKLLDEKAPVFAIEDEAAFSALKKYEYVVLGYCKNKVLDKNCNIYKQGKNWYCEVENIKITINSNSYTIITAHIVK